MADCDTAEVEFEEIRYGNRVFSGRALPPRCTNIL